MGKFLESSRMWYLQIGKSIERANLWDNYSSGLVTILKSKRENQKKPAIVKKKLIKMN